LESDESDEGPNTYFSYAFGMQLLYLLEYKLASFKI
jgi:hypothetical protein